MIGKCFMLGISLLLAQTCSLFSDAPPSNIDWQTNYEAAAQQAKATSKPLLLFFTGSDWCTWCNKLDEEALNTPDFANKVGNKFIFVKLDFPLYSAQDSQLKIQNKQLQQRFDVRSYPTIIIVDPQQNQQIGSTGYRPGGGQLFADHLLQLIDGYSSYKQKMSALDSGKLTGHEFKQLYEKAKKLDLQNDANRIVKRGIHSDESLFFLTERYRFLSYDGQIHSKEAMALRQQLLAADPSNQKFIPYQIAIIEYETYAAEMEKEHYSPEIAIAPLNAYIEKYGHQDKEHLWRLQMMIAQVYLDKDQMLPALKYAQDCYESAPYAAQSEIARAVQNIRSQAISSPPPLTCH